MPFLIDSNVLIDISRGDSAAIKYLDALREHWSISQVSLQVVPLNQSIGAEARRLPKTYAKSHGLRVFDSLIAATAIEKALTLVTLNRKRYEGWRIRFPSMVNTFGTGPFLRLK